MPLVDSQIIDIPALLAGQNFAGPGLDVPPECGSFAWAFTPNTTPGAIATAAVQGSFDGVTWRTISSVGVQTGGATALMASNKLVAIMPKLRLYIATFSGAGGGYDGGKATLRLLTTSP